MKNSPEFRQNLMIGILGSIFVIIFVQPVLSWIWSLLVEHTPRVFLALVDRVYLNAALGQREWVVAGTTLVALGVMCLIALRVTIIHLQNIGSLWGLIPAPKEQPEVSESKKSKRFIWIIILVDIAGLGAITILAVSIFTDLQLNTSFSQRLTVLNAHCSVDEINKLKAEWAMMENRDDYLRIETKMESMAKAKGIRIPEPLMK